MLATQFVVAASLNSGWLELPFNRDCTREGDAVYLCSYVAGLLTALLMAREDAAARASLFEKYMVKDAMKGPVRSVEGVSNLIVVRRREMETAQEFLRRLRSAALGRITFAGRHAVVAYSCGAGCTEGALVDVVSGRVAFLPFNVTMCRDQLVQPLDCRPFSRLLMAEGELEWSRGASESEMRSGCGPHYFLWTGKRLERISVALAKE